MSKDTKVTQIKGTITTADGKVTEFEIGEDFGWRQWGNDNTAPTLGTRVGVLEAIVAGLKDNEGGDYTFASASDEDEPDDDLEDLDEEDDEDGDTYRIVRFYGPGDERENEVQDTGLTLAEAKAHCSTPMATGDGWFDGFQKEA